MKVTIIVGFLAALFAAAIPAAERPDAAKTDRAVVQGDTQFALDLYAKLRSQDGNLFFSPYSISTALAMTRAGRQGRHRRPDGQGAELHPPAGQAESGLRGTRQGGQRRSGGQERGYQLSTANALWGQKDYGFKADFVKLLNDDYGPASTRWISRPRTKRPARLSTPGWKSRRTTRSKTSCMKAISRS